MITWGINALNHDASIAVIDDRELKFWKRSSEYSGKAGDDKIHSELFKDALTASHGRGPALLGAETKVRRRGVGGLHTSC